MEMFDLSGKTAIVTGGNRGIGFGIAQGLAKVGATVVIANRDAVSGQSAADSLAKEGYKAIAIPTNIDKVSSISAMVNSVVNNFGKIDILVNNAAAVIRKPAEDFTEEDWDAIVNTNLKGTFFCMQLVGREMIKQRKGKIINLTSVLSVIAQPGRAIYATTKAGIVHMTRVVGAEWAQYNINVNAIGPGVTITELNRVYYETHPDEFKKTVDGVPKGREAYPRDYAGAAIFLASDASDYMVGQTLMIDGGMTLV